VHPKIFQVEPQNDFSVYVYFDDGKIKQYDMKSIIDKGGIFMPLKDAHFFKNRCVVLNRSLAWDMTGDLDPTECIDICPDLIYEKGIDVLR